jgi:hypothetical protein
MHVLPHNQAASLIFEMLKVVRFDELDLKREQRKTFINFLKEIFGSFKLHSTVSKDTGIGQSDDLTHKIMKRKNGK